MTEKILEQKFYVPTQTYEFYDRLEDEWFNKLGQKLRDPEEYNEDSEGYTPFGDE